MRISREILINLARKTVASRSKNNPYLVSAYLCGALLEEDYLLGGTADIDLVFVYLNQPAQPREIVRLSDEVHLDIAHQSQTEYDQPRKVRLHPWLGHAVFSCLPLYDVGHFMDFTQASVRGQFDRPDNVLARAHPQLEHARNIWQSLQTLPAEPGITEVSLYLRAVEHAANSIALLSGAPLTERRFLLKFPARAEAINRSGLYPGLLGLLGANHVDRENLRVWLPQWEATWNALPQPAAHPRLHAHRKDYYQRAFRALLEMGEPHVLIWPLINTWTLAVKYLPSEAPGHRAWREACNRLGLFGNSFKERVEALDAYLDLIEETDEIWGREAGL